MLDSITGATSNLRGSGAVTTEINAFLTVPGLTVQDQGVGWVPVCLRNSCVLPLHGISCVNMFIGTCVFALISFSY